MESMNINNTQVKETVSFDEALLSLGRTTPAQLFTHAYKCGNSKAIPETLLKNVWQHSPIAENKLERYYTNVYFVQYCAAKYWEYAHTDKEEAEQWKNKGMEAWGTILALVGSEYFRYGTDWLYFVACSISIGKESKESKIKVLKATSETTFRKRVEILIGMTLNGYVFVNPMVSPEIEAEKRMNKAKRGAEKEARRIAAIAKAEAKKQAAQDAPAETDAPAVTQTAEKPAQVKQQKQQAKKAKQQPVTLDATIDTLPAFDGLFDDMIIPGKASDTNADTDAA